MNRLLKEDGFVLLKEDTSSLLLEGYASLKEQRAAEWDGLFYYEGEWMSFGELRQRIVVR